MCQSKVEKEEVIFNQNGAENKASVDQLKYHLSSMSIILIIICSLLAIGGVYFILKLYRRCHKNWTTDMIVQYTLRRSFNRGPRNELHDAATAGCHRCEPRVPEKIVQVK